MKLKNVYSIVIFTLTGIIFTNCTQQKHFYGNSFQTKSTSDTTRLNMEKEIINYVNEARKVYQEQTKLQLEETVLASTAPHIIFKKKIKNDRREVRIHKYKILYMDAANYLEKKEMRKCYNEISANKEVVDCNDTEENIFGFVFSFPFVFIASFMFAIITMVLLAKKIN